MTTPLMATWLGGLGLLPFIVATSLVLGQAGLGPISGELLFLTYSAVIFSFLCGTLWSHALRASTPLPAAWLLLVSNLLALLAWACLLAGQDWMQAAVMALAAGYGVLMLLEHRCVHILLKDVYRGYLRLRLTLSGVVLVCHLLVLVSV